MRKIRLLYQFSIVGFMTSHINVFVLKIYFSFLLLKEQCLNKQMETQTVFFRENPAAEPWNLCNRQLSRVRLLA